MADWILLPQPWTMVAYPKAMYNMSSLLHTKYGLLALLQNTSYLLFTINSLTETPAPQKLIYPSSAYQLPQYLALGPTTMSSAMPNLHQCWHKKGAQCVCTAAQRRLVSDGWCDYLIRSTTCFLFRNKIVEFSFSGTNVAIITTIQPLFSCLVFCVSCLVLGPNVVSRWRAALSTRWKHCQELIKKCLKS